MKNDYFLMFFAIWIFFPKFFDRLRRAYARIVWNDKSVTCSVVPNCFYFLLWTRLAGSSIQGYEKWSFYFVFWARLVERSVQSYEKWSFFTVFSHLGPFPQDFGQAKQWLIWELHEMIRVLHVVACSITFILFYKQDWRGGVFKVMKNDNFLVFLAV